MKKVTFYSGEHTCNGKYKNGTPCQRIAYYEGAYCGLHKKTSKKLPKNPNIDKLKKEAIAEHMKTIVKSETPSLTATKMLMMKNPTPKIGHYLVCPNNKHGHNFGYPGDYSDLSPMRLGPINDNLATNIGFFFNIYRRLLINLIQFRKLSSICKMFST